jgi:anthranilate phosphoribosyltransferase
MLGVEAAPLDGVKGGDPRRNAEMVEAVLSGKVGPARTAVVVNAAAALLVGDAADDWASAARRAEASIDEGKAAAALERLRAATNA